ERPDGDGLIVIPAAARGLTRRTADASANAGERVRAASDQVGATIVALGDGPHVAARVGVNGARLLTLDLPPPVVDVRKLNVVTSVSQLLAFGHASLGWQTPGVVEMAKGKATDMPTYDMRISSAIQRRRGSGPPDPHTLMCGFVPTSV